MRLLDLNKSILYYMNLTYIVTCMEFVDSSRYLQNQKKISDSKCDEPVKR